MPKCGGAQRVAVCLSVLLSFGVPVHPGPLVARGADGPASAEPAQPTSVTLGTLFEAELRARSGMPPAVSAEGRDGTLVGSGDGTVRGPKIRGKLRWSNFEKTSDTVCQLNLAGVIDTDDGARIEFDTQGFALLANPPRWDTAGAMRFETKDERYAWLNGLLASWQGNFDPTTFSATLRAFTRAPQGAAKPASRP